MRGVVAAMMWGMTGSLALAHPHVFIDTRLVVHVDDAGIARGVEVSWTYDDFYSFLLFEDFGLDRDADGELTAEEIAKLDGFDMQWVPGYEGDLYLRSGDTLVSLGAPEGRGVSVSKGFITSTHYRSFEAPAAGLEIKAYDPTYYTAYTLAQGVEIGGGCAATVTPADLNQAYSALEELLYATPAVDAETQFPEVGENFADTVVITCE